MIFVLLSLMNDASVTAMERLAATVSGTSISITFLALLVNDETGNETLGLNWC